MAYSDELEYAATQDQLVPYTLSEPEANCLASARIVCQLCKAGFRTGDTVVQHPASERYAHADCADGLNP